MTHETTIDGLKVKHAIVTRTCRENRGVEGAIDEALARLRAAYLDTATAPANAAANFHVVLTVDRWLDSPVSESGDRPR